MGFKHTITAVFLHIGIEPFSSSFTSASSHSRLPFLSRTRLVAFFGSWPPGCSEHHFLVNYLQAQEEAFHGVLAAIGFFNLHLDYWLDWSGPVRRRPLWAHTLARKLMAARLWTLGRGWQVAEPMEVARHFAAIHGELCKLLAFIQISTFELLSAELDTPVQRQDVLYQVAQNLSCQGRACKQIMAALRSWPSDNAKGTPTSLASMLSSTKQVPRTDSKIPDELSATSLAEQVSPRLRPASAPFSSLPSSPSLTFEAVDSNESSDEFDSKASHERLLATRLSMCRLLEKLDLHIRAYGKPSHFVRYQPFYIALAGMAVYKGHGPLFNSAKRIVFIQDCKVVWKQFYHEWIRDPVQQLFAELFRRLHVDDKLMVQLKELKAEEEALNRMLHHFAEILKTDPSFSVKSLTQWFSGFSAESNDTQAKEFDYGSDDLAERYFEKSMMNPLANVMNGHLTESCMVQSQRMKVLLYSSLYSVDAVLMQLKWDFLMAGIMPFISVCGLFFWVLNSIRRRSHWTHRRMMARALAEVDRYYNHHSYSLGRVDGPNHQVSSKSFENLLGTSSQMREALLDPRLGAAHRQSPKLSGFYSVSSYSPLRRSAGLPEDSDNSGVELEKVGAALSHLDALCRIAANMRLEEVDWRTFRRDILDLASPELSVSQKLHAINRIRSSYDVIFSV